MTPRERRKLYGKTYHYLTHKNPTYFYLCDAFTKVTDDWTTSWEIELPEFGMFKPRKNEDLTGLGWWDDKDKEVRLTALLLCKEMTKDENTINYFNSRTRRVSR